MTLSEVARTYKRICEFYAERCCEGCPIAAKNFMKPEEKFMDGRDCLNAMLLYPDEYEKVLLDWAKENPAPTNRDKFFEVFGDRNYKHEGCKVACELIPCCDCDWWNKAYVEPDKGEK